MLTRPSQLSRLRTISEGKREGEGEGEGGGEEKEGRKRWKGEREGRKEKKNRRAFDERQHLKAKAMSDLGQTLVIVPCWWDGEADR